MSVGKFSSQAGNLQFALYLEGIRVPFIRASVTSAVNRPSMCTVELPPFASATALRPKTLVHLFYYDAPFINSKAESPSPDQPEWRLLFEGEVSHIDVAQNTGNKSVTLICQDFTNYWHHVYQYFINNHRDLFSSAIEIATFANGNFNPQLATIYNNDFPGSLREDIVLNTILGSTGARRSNPIIGLLDLIVLIGGEASISTPKGINRFFSDAENRLKMARRVFALRDDQLSNFFSVKTNTAALKFMSAITEKLGGLGTVADVIERFLSHTFYDYVSFIAPPFGINRSIDSDNSTPKNVSSGEQTVLGTMLKPKTFFLPPPRCNVMFPSKLSSFRFSRSFLDEPSRLRMKIQTGFPATNVPNIVDGLQELTVYAPPKANIASAIQSEATQTSTIQAGIHAASPTGFLPTNDPQIPAFKSQIANVLRSYGFHPDGSNLVFDADRDISEPECGIVPILQDLDINQTILIESLAIQNRDANKSIQTVLGEDAIAQERLRYFLASANYQLDVRKFNFRRVDNVSGPFNPNLLVGFPAAIIDSMALILGDLDSVTHSIDANGGAITTTQLSHARSLAVDSFLPAMSDLDIAGIFFEEATQVAEYLDPVTGNVTRPGDLDTSDFPPFLNSKFFPANIDAQVYVPVFGTNSIFNEVQENVVLGIPIFSNSGVQVSGQFEALFELYRGYLLSKDKIAYVNFCTKRDITSVNQLRQHYNVASNVIPTFQDKLYALTTDEELFGTDSGPIFRPISGGAATKQEQVKKLTEDIRRSLGVTRDNNITRVRSTRQRRGGVVGT